MLAATNSPAQPATCRLSPEQHQRWAGFLVRVYLERHEQPPVIAQEKPKGGGR